MVLLSVLIVLLKMLFLVLLDKNEYKEKENLIYCKDLIRGWNCYWIKDGWIYFVCYFFYNFLFCMCFINKIILDMIRVWKIVELILMKILDVKFFYN